VNEVKLEVPGEESVREGLLVAWLDAGHDPGNHTCSHRRLYDTPLVEFQAEVLRGERVTRRLLAARGRAPRYFRHPTLNTGRDAGTQAAFEAFLAGHGYAVAPVTIDNDEYLYAAAYDRARALMARLGRDYLRYMREVLDGSEQTASSSVIHSDHGRFARQVSRPRSSGMRM
jgi:peptidoglycan/xylan/chitin deacetylase (PgdA/CDA1 family)